MQKESTHGEGEGGKHFSRRILSNSYKISFPALEEGFRSSDLNLVFLGIERNQTSKERLWFLVRHLEIREAKVYVNEFSDLQNSFAN